jgi:hypothetical protein
MRKVHNHGSGGGKTNANGLHFEEVVCIRQHLIRQGYTITNNDVFLDGKPVAKVYAKYEIYTKFLDTINPEFKNVLSKKLLPDGAVLVGDTMYIIEVKYQNGNGSVDEKIQTCHFKKRQYEKLFGQVNLKVEYYYRFNEWFNQPKYKDHLDYINEVDCKYYFDDIPLNDLGLYP